jgi:hypothetical protein
MVHGTDFPRAYRRIHAVPLGLARSAVLLESHASDGSIDKALRGGAATFRFMPKTAELGLNLKVLLTQRDGQELDCKMIEPQK